MAAGPSPPRRRRRLVLLLLAVFALAIFVMVLRSPTRTAHQTLHETQAALKHTLDRAQRPQAAQPQQPPQPQQPQLFPRPNQPLQPLQPQPAPPHEPHQPQYQPQPHQPAPPHEPGLPVAGGDDGQRPPELHGSPSSADACVLHVPLLQLPPDAEVNLIASLERANRIAATPCHLCFYTPRADPLAVPLPVQKHATRPPAPVLLPPVQLRLELERAQTQHLPPVASAREPMQAAHIVYEALDPLLKPLLSGTRTTHHLLLLGHTAQLHPQALDTFQRLRDQLALGSPGSAPTLAGISLHDPTFDLETLGYRPLLSESRHTAEFYTLQQPQLLGGFMRWGHAVRYLLWRQLRGKPLLLRPLEALEALYDARAWHGYLTELQSTMLYPPYHPGSMLASPRFASRLANADETSAIHKAIHDLSLQRLPVYNAASKWLHTDASILYARDSTVFRQCTLVLQVYGRYDQLDALLEFYHHALPLRAIVVVWNRVDQPLPLIDPERYRVKVHVTVEEKNSINNRYRPRPEITTDCVINMDDDWRMPHQVLFFASRLWYYRHPQQLLGVKRLARLHAIAEDGRFLYLKNATAPQSIVLPSGTVYHRRYHEVYWKSVPQWARDAVDQRINCEDILLNMVVANTSGLPPVLIDTQEVRRAKVVKELGKDAGLWRRGSHWQDRSNCLNEFSRLFTEEMPLRYTTQSYTIDDHLGRPPPQPVPERATAGTLCRLVPGSCDDDCVECAPLSGPPG